MFKLKYYKTWWIIVGVFAVAVLFNRTVSVVVLGFVSFLAFKEYLSLVPTRRADHRVLFWAYLAIPIQFYWVWMAWYGMFILFIPVFVFLFLPMRMILIGETQGFLRAIGTLQWGFDDNGVWLESCRVYVGITCRSQSSGWRDGATDLFSLSH